MTERCRALTAVCACLLLSGPAWAVTVTYGDVKVTRYNDPQGHTAHGYTDYRFLVQNDSKEEAHVVRLALPSDDVTRGGRIAEVSRAVKVEPGKTMLVSLLLPAEPGAYGSGVSVWLDGRKQGDRIPVAIATGGYSGMRGVPVSRGVGTDMLILYSQRVPEDFFTPVIPKGGTAMMGMGVGMGGPPRGVVRAEDMAAENAAAVAEAVVDAVERLLSVRTYTLSGSQTRADSPISAWSRHWLAFSRYDGIVVTAEDLAELGRGGNDTEAVLRSLYQYVEAGGVLVVLGKGAFAFPSSWGRQSYVRDGVTVYSPVFGRCFVTPNADSANWTYDRWAIFDECRRTGQPFNDSHNLSDLNLTLPPVDDLSVPKRGLFLMMCLFGIGIGPVNVWLLSRWNRRIWLLWTVPAASALTCAAVFGYMVVSEGWQGHARVTGLTVLDETEKRATSIGRTSFYSPLTPSDGLRFEADTEVTVVGAIRMDLRHRYGMTESTLGPCVVDWGEGGEQRLARGWVSARVPAHFMLRKSQAEERRVMVAREGEKLVLTNALGTAIKRIKLADEKGALYEADEIAAGAKAELRPVKGKKEKVTPARGELRLHAFGVRDWATAPAEAYRQHEALLTPRSYVAVVEGSPFLEQAMKGAKERETESVVMGLMADLK